MISIREFTLCLATAALAVAAGAPPSVAQDRVGVSGAVNPDANATPPGGTTRRLVLGQPIVFNEHIATAAAGQTQILFLDESAMTIGPGSDVTIDQFVYNPKTSTGRLAISATHGILRLVGGKLSKGEDAVTLRTATATLAVRGGVVLIEQDLNGRLDVYFIYGEYASVTGTNGVTQLIRRPGFAVTVLGPGSSPSSPHRTPDEALKRLLVALDGRTGGTGGIAQGLSDDIVADSGLSTVISGDFDTSLENADQSQPQPTLPVLFDVGSVGANFLLTTVGSQGNPVIVLLDSNPSIATGAVTSPTRTSYPDTGFAVVDTTPAGLNRPALLEAAQAVLQNGTLGAVATNAALSFPLAPGTNSFGPQGAVGVFGAPSGGTVVGSFSGTSFLAPDNAFFYVLATSPSFPHLIGALEGGLPTVNLPTTGTGSYSGSVSGAVVNNGSTTFANGSFTNVYNFGYNTGNFTISNFDGNTLSASVSAIGALPGQTLTTLASNGVPVPANVGTLLYGGTLTGNGLKGQVGGGFFGTGASDTGGVFGVKNPSGSYQAGGVFGGHR